MNFSIHTLGCKVNQYESEQIIAELKKFGWKYVDFSDKADVYVINSCTVTAVANHKSRQLIRRALKKNPDGLVVVTGCYADSDREEIAKISGIGLVLGNSSKKDIPQLLAERFGLSAAGNNEAGESASRQLHTRSLVKIQDGCNQFCSYCIVPYVRGDLQSHPEEEVVDEVSRLVAGGAQEIVLTGIHLGLYGANNDYDLGSLLEKLVKIPRLGRIRLSSIELNEITPQIIELISNSDKICNHLHIPLQSGSDRTLSKMNRHYTANEFMRRTDELRRKIDNLAITTDVIVGFPGETEQDFGDTIKFVERVAFSKLHVFKFSPRKDTPAANFNEQIPSIIKDKRSVELINTGHKLSAAYASKYVGNTLSVLVERVQGGHLSSVSDNYIRVYCEGPSELVGQLANVKVIKQEDAVLYGKVI